MRTFVKVIIILCLSCGLAFAQTVKPKIAVYVKGGANSGESAALVNMMQTAFVQSGKYTTIERGEAFLNEIANEQKKQRSGAIDDSQIAKLGMQFGAKFVCIVEIIDVLEVKQVTARIINVETAVIVAMETANSSLNTYEKLEKVSQTLVNSLLGITPPLPPPKQPEGNVGTGRGNGTTIIDPPDHRWRFSFGGGVIFLSRWDDAYFNEDFKFKNLSYITCGYDMMLSFLFPIGEEDYLMIGPEAVFSSMFDRYGNTPLAFNVPVKLRYTPGGDSEDGWFLDAGVLAGMIWSPSILSDKESESVFDYGAFFGIGHNPDDLYGIRLRCQFTNTHWALKVYFEF